MTCACGQELLALASVECGFCEFCNLFGPAAPGSRIPKPVKAQDDPQAAVDAPDEDEDVGHRRAQKPPPIVGPACVHCGSTVVDLLKGKARRGTSGPAHLECLGIHAPSVTVAVDDDPPVYGCCGCGNALMSEEARDTSRCRPCRDDSVKVLPAMLPLDGPPERHA